MSAFWYALAVLQIIYKNSYAYWVCTFLFFSIFGLDVHTNYVFVWKENTIRFI